MAGSTLGPGVVVIIQTFGNRINFHPHLHFQVTEGGVDEAGVFHKILGTKVYRFLGDYRGVWDDEASANLLHGHFLVLDFDQRSGISFFRKEMCDLMLMGT
ncbi:MAG: transposase [Candidatus Aminicenantes bacterium]|nr:transposase [Candidatus Aminicenantes bacterium]